VEAARLGNPSLREDQGEVPMRAGAQTKRRLPNPCLVEAAVQKRSVLGEGEELVVE